MSVFALHVYVFWLCVFMHVEYIVIFVGDAEPCQPKKVGRGGLDPPGRANKGGSGVFRTQ